MTDAVQTVSSCWTCWPAEAQDSEPGSLKDRVCIYWRMGPGLLCLTASVIAVICSIYWQAPSLCGAFVPSGASSIYLIYLAWDFQNLQTLSENNEKFKESLGNLETENERLQASNTTLNTQLSALRNSLGGLQTENSTLRASNVQLTRSVSGLEQSVRDLEQLRSTLQIRLDAEVTQLKILHTGLSHIQVSAKQDHSSFAGQLAIFIKQVELLQQTREQFEKAGSQVQTQTVSLVESAKVLESIFSQICEWKDGEEVRRRLSMAENLGAQVSRFQGQLKIQKLQLEEQKIQVEHLKTVREGFEQLLGQLLVVANELKLTNGSLAQKVEKVVQECKTYEL